MYDIAFGKAVPSWSVFPWRGVVVCSVLVQAGSEAGADKGGKHRGWALRAWLRHTLLCCRPVQRWVPLPGHVEVLEEKDRVVSEVHIQELCIRWIYGVV